MPCACPFGDAARQPLAVGLIGEYRPRAFTLYRLDERRQVLRRGFALGGYGEYRPDYLKPVPLGKILETVVGRYQQAVF